MRSGIDCAQRSNEKHRCCEDVSHNHSLRFYHSGRGYSLLQNERRLLWLMVLASYFPGIHKQPGHNSKNFPQRYTWRWNLLTLPTSNIYRLRDTSFPTHSRLPLPDFTSLHFIGCKRHENYFWKTNDSTIFSKSEFFFLNKYSVGQRVTEVFHSTLKTSQMVMMQLV